MLCRESKRILSAYVDNEVDLLTGLAVEDHLAGCTTCAHDVENYRSVRNIFRDADLRFSSPPELKRQILANLQPKQGLFKIPHWLSVPFPTWASAAAIIVCLVAALLFYVRQDRRQAADEVVDNHIRSMLANHLADVPSSDQHTVKPWFNGKISFSPKVQDFGDKGYPLVGGRLDYMANQTVSVLIYKRRQHIINVFIHPDSEEIRPVTSEKRGYNLIHWASGGMEYWTISDLNASELQDFTALLRQ